MNNFNHLLKKAVYLGVGLASYAGEGFSDRFNELAQDVQKKADELVKRGEITTEEARRLVNQVLTQAQNQAQSAARVSPPPTEDVPEPQTIDISFEEET